MSADNETQQYRRVRWQNGGAFSRGSLWLAGDHVLQITSSGIQERYQRFYLRDIKAIMICDAHSSPVGGLICGFFAFIFGMGMFLALLPPASSGGVTVLFVFFAITLLMTILFLWRGRTVKVFAVTELQTVLWRSVARKWQSEKLLAQLTPLINAAQADLARAQPASEEPQTPPQVQQNPGGSAGAA